MTRFFVAGATGKQGGATARALLASGHEVNAYVRDRASTAAESLARLGATLFEGDWDSAESLEAAVAGCSAVFFPSMPSFTESEAEGRWAGNILAAAASSGTVGHVVYSTVSIVARFEQVRRVEGWDDNAFMAQYFLSKVEGEEAVRRWADGGLRYTILRPCGFMSNWLAPWTSFQTPDLISEGVWHTAFSSDFPMPLIDTEDVGRIAAVAMQDPEGWHGREVELIAETLPLKEVIRLLSEVSGKQLRIHTYTEQEAEKLSKENPLVKGMMIRIKTDSLGGPPAKDLNLPFDLKTFRNYLDENREVVLETYAKVNNQTL